MSSILEPLRVPLQALLIGLAGVGLASLWFNHHRLIGAAAVVGGIVLGWAIDACGNNRLPGHPVFALHLLEGWLLIPLALAAAAAAAVVIVTVELTVPDSAATTTKELIGGASTGITTFLTAGFIAWTSDDDDSTLADHVEERFQAHYTRGATTTNGMRGFRANSAGERWVFSEAYGGIDGWGRAARKTRAKGIKAELMSSGSNP
ncbi:MAG: hypothetical protein QOC78_1376 [Solirubrobacteraceae bacterium]|jgi:hypothetical protein|nr:hypothetical protein [Solirubrobacteraceae bacterium]